MLMLTTLIYVKSFKIVGLMELLPYAKINFKREKLVELH